MAPRHHAPPVGAPEAVDQHRRRHTWQQVRVSSHGNGTYTGTYAVSALSTTNGYVSIKAQASDAVGNNVTQTITNAYSLTAPRLPPDGSHWS
jgi:hypothetical protein